jgi:hypothetical protein
MIQLKKPRDPQRLFCQYPMITLRAKHRSMETAAAATALFASSRPYPREEADIRV